MMKRRPVFQSFLPGAVSIFVGICCFGSHNMNATSFQPLHQPLRVYSSMLLSSPNDSSSTAVRQLLNLVLESDQDEMAIREGVSKLGDFGMKDKDESSVSPATFEALIGNYNVSCTLPSRPSERPVGGKWNNGPFSILHSWQNILPATKAGSVAQVINVIVLRTLFWRVFVVLRGDAYSLDKNKRDEIAQERNTPGGLSSRTVRADFEPPRIALVGGKKTKKRILLNLTLGPPSSVVLDTPFSNDELRIGKGSRGSTFVFVRTQDPRAEEWEDILQTRPMSRRQGLAILGATAVSSLAAGVRMTGLTRWLSVPVFILSALSCLLFAISTGGIERERDSVNSIPSGIPLAENS